MSTGAELRDRGETYVYPILSDQGYFDVGKTEDGRQVLMGLMCPSLVAIFFDLDGHLLGFEKRRLPIFDPGGGARGIYDERIPPVQKAWQAEMGFRPTPIRVKRFFIEEEWVGIEDYPAHFGEILGDTETSDEEKAEIRNSIGSWEADGMFVVHWGNDLWLDGTGEVVST